MTEKRDIVKRRGKMFEEIFLGLTPFLGIFIMIIHWIFFGY